MYEYGLLKNASVFEIAQTPHSTGVSTNFDVAVVVGSCIVFNADAGLGTGGIFVAKELTQAVNAAAVVAPLLVASGVNEFWPTEAELYEVKAPDGGMFVESTVQKFVVLVK